MLFNVTVARLLLLYHKVDTSLDRSSSCQEVSLLLLIIIVDVSIIHFLDLLQLCLPLLFLGKFYLTRPSVRPCRY